MPRIKIASTKLFQDCSNALRRFLRPYTQTPAKNMNSKTAITIPPVMNGIMPVPPANGKAGPPMAVFSTVMVSVGSPNIGTVLLAGVEPFIAKSVAVGSFRL